MSLMFSYSFIFNFEQLIYQFLYEICLRGESNQFPYTMRHKDARAKRIITNDLVKSRKVIDLQCSLMAFTFFVVI